MSKYFKNISLRLFFILLGISTLLTAHAWLNQSPHIQAHIAATLVLLVSLAYWLARSINRIRRYAEAMAANRTAIQPQFGDSYLYRLVHAIAHLRRELNHRQHIENYILGLTHELRSPPKPPRWNCCKTARSAPSNTNWLPASSATPKTSNSSSPNY